MFAPPRLSRLVIRRERRSDHAHTPLPISHPGITTAAECVGTVSAVIAVWAVCSLLVCAFVFGTTFALARRRTVVGRMARLRVRLHFRRGRRGQVPTPEYIERGIADLERWLERESTS